MIWVGTYNGLSRYDGHHFYNFKATVDTTPFINREIIDLCEDKAGNIWGATASGIFCYEVKQNKLVNYIPPTYDFARRVNNIICDKQGNIWASTEWNIIKLNRKTNHFEEIGPLTHNKDSLRYYAVRQNGLREDPSGKGLWFATRSGIHFYNTTTATFDSYKNKPADPLFINHSVAALNISASGKGWFFDNVTKEIICFDPATHALLQRINMETVMPGVVGQTIFEDSNHKLWFSTWDTKMAVIDHRENRITSIAYKQDNPLSVAGDGFWDAFEDADNNVWLATAGGISRCNYTKNVYDIIPIVESIPECSNGQLGAFAIDPVDKSWWIATEGHVSVIQYYPATGKYNYFDFTKAVKDNKGQVPGPVFGISFIDDQAYACTHTGIWQLDKRTKSLVPFEIRAGGLSTAGSNYFVVQGDDVWFTSKEGYIKWNKRTGQARAIKAKFDSLPDGQRTSYSRVSFDKTCKPWFVPAFGWLAYIDELDEVQPKYYIKDKAKELAGYLTSVVPDDRGHLWMAGAGVGLYRYTISTGTMKLYDQAEGITSSIRQLSMDNNNRLWIAAANKFTVFNTITQSASYFNLPLYEHTINYSSVLQKDSSGAMLATVYKDVVRFMPWRMSLKPVLKEPLVSMIKISGKEKLLSDEKALYLHPEENSLEFSFGSLISTEIFPYSFEYRLEGFDKQWQTATASAAALYNNLQPGTYTFSVKAVAKDKTWQTPEKIITVTIRTPFYKAAWFWVLIAVLLLATLFVLYRFRLNKQKQILLLQTKAQQLEKEKTMVMYDSLKQQLNPHFLFNSLTSLSGLIETDQEVAGNFLEQMSGIYRYILKHGDSETVSLKDELEFVQLYINLQQTRFKSGLQVQVRVPDDYLHYKIAPVTLQNLIENAIKHNIIDAGSPLVIQIFIEGEYLVVQNNLQKKNVVETSNKKGLKQFISLYSYLSYLPVLIKEDEQYFTIEVPLI